LPSSPFAARRAQEAHKLEVVKPPMAVTNAVSWRSEGIKHRKNEIFLDVVERLNLLVAANGTLLRSEILGSLKMRSYLSGMPELKLGLNDKLLFEATGRRTGGRGMSKGKAVEMEDIKFHQCVRLARFENDRTISFIPPDGEFELMSYRLNTQVRASPSPCTHSCAHCHHCTAVEAGPLRRPLMARGRRSNRCCG
jgi:AP-1 complex subunit mu